MHQIGPVPFQILAPDGSLSNPALIKNLGLEGVHLLQMYKYMVTLRLFYDELTGLGNKKGILYIGPKGQEAAQIGSICALNMYNPKPTVFAYARSHGPLLTRISLELLAGAFFHYGNMPPEMVKVFLQNRMEALYTAVGICIPHAVGSALAAKIKGEIDPTIVYFGDGATAEGDFYSGLNWATIFKVPVIFFCENNQWAISTPTSYNTPTLTFAEKTLGFGYDLAVEWVDGNDFLAVYAVTRLAYERALHTSRPTMIEAITYRLGTHTTKIGDMHKIPEGELERARKNDPLIRSKHFLLSDAAKKLGVEWSEDQDKAMCEKVALEVKTAVNAAYEEFHKIDVPETIKRNVRINTEPLITKRPTIRHRPFNPERITNALALDAAAFAILDAAHTYKHVFAIGEDIAEIGGVLRNWAIQEKVARVVFPDYLDRVLQSALPLKVLLPNNIYNSPLDESGLGGVGLGIALNGVRTIIEPQFSGFLWQMIHQIQEMARVSQRYAGLREISIVLRLPFGGSAIEYHNESEIKALFGIPGIIVACPWNLQGFYDLMFAAIASGKPVALFENIILNHKLTGEFERRLPYKPIEDSDIDTIQEGQDVTIVSYGRLVYDCIEAARIVEAKEGVTSTVLAIQVFNPFKKDQLIKAVQKTGRLLIVHEEQIQHGTGAELSALVAGESKTFEYLRAPIRRVGAPFCHPPSPENLKHYTPQKSEIIQAILELTKS